MLRKICFLTLMVILFLISFSQAQEATTNILSSPNVFLTLVDASTKEAISEAFVKLEYNNETKYYYLEKDENLKLNLKSGEYNLHIWVNIPQTESYDYYGETTLNIDKSTLQAIYLLPIGSLQGFVKDKLDNVIAGADLKFECYESGQLLSKADQFGSFSKETVPIGKCKIYGSYEDNTGSSEVEIIQGKKATVEIKLNQVLISSGKYYNYNNYLIFGFIIILIITIGIIFFNWKYNKKMPQSKKEEKKEGKERKKLKKEEMSAEKGELGRRGKDLLLTLRENEKKIVKFLLEEKEPLHLSKIHYKTGISKGALFRNINSLEQKNIIVTVKEGRVRKIKLSEWFLEQ